MHPSQQNVLKKIVLTQNCTFYLLLSLLLFIWRQKRTSTELCTI